jgi:hypothetical protein
MIENEVLTASCENLEPSSQNAPITHADMRAKVMPIMLNSQKVRVLLLC